MSQVPNLSEEKWAEIHKRLTLYAEDKVFERWWRGARGSKCARGSDSASIPGGLGPADIASEAIVDFINGTRVWNQAKQPDLLKFLKGVVDSKVNHLATSVENKKMRNPVPTKDEDGNEQEFDIEAKERGAEVIHAVELAAEVLEALRAEIGGDPLVEQILDCLEAEITTPSDMAAVLGTSVKDINNAQKRLRTKVEKVRRTLGIRSGSRT